MLWTLHCFNCHFDKEERSVTDYTNIIMFVLQMDNFTSFHFYFLSIWWEWLLVARFTCYIWYFSDPQNIPLLKVCRWLWHIIEIIWPYHHTSTPPHHTHGMAIPRYQFGLFRLASYYIFLVFAFKKKHLRYFWVNYITI